MPSTLRALCSGARWQKLTAPHRQAWAQAAAPCAICHQPIDYSLDACSRWGLTVDHVTPLWAGGQPLDPGNWQPAHRRCNSRRGATEGNKLRNRRPQPAPITDLTW